MHDLAMLPWVQGGTEFKSFTVVFDRTKTKTLQAEEIKV